MEGEFSEVRIAQALPQSDAESQSYVQNEASWRIVHKIRIMPRQDRRPSALLGRLNWGRTMFSKRSILRPFVAGEEMGKNVDPSDRDQYYPGNAAPASEEPMHEIGM